MTNNTDAELLAQAIATPAAFETLVIRHHPAIYRYVARRLGPNTAEDVVNEVFTTAYAIRSRYDTARPDARPWLFGIATNMIHRHRKHEAQVLAAYARTGVHPELPDAPHHDDELGPALAAALAAMRREHRDVLLLHAIADLTYEEIGVAMNVPIGTVRRLAEPRPRSRRPRARRPRGVADCLPHRHRSEGHRTVNEIDELFRDYMAHSPGPGPGAAQHVARAVVAAPAPVKGIGLRRPRLRIASIVSGLSAAGLASVLAFLLVQAPNNASPGSEAGTPRVSWGMSASVRVVPRPGTSLDTAVEHAVRAIADRGRARDIAGLAVERVGADTLRITVPAANNDAQVADLTGFTPLSIYRSRDATVVKTRAELAAATLRLGGPGAGYLVMQDTDQIGAPRYAASRAEADRQLAIANTPTINVPANYPRTIAVPMPDNVRVVFEADAATGKVRQLAFFKADPIVRPADISAAHADGTRVVLTVDPTVAVSLAAEAAASPSPDAFIAAVTMEGRVDVDVGVPVLSGNELTIQTGQADAAKAIVAQAGRPPVDADLAVLHTERYGQIPPLTGERVTQLPAEIERARTRVQDPRSPEAVYVEVPKENIVKVVGTTLNGRQVDLFAGRTPAADDVLWITPSIPTPGANCQPALGAPELQSCGASGTGRIGSQRRDIGFFGRVNSTDIATVEAQVPGHPPLPGAVANGWFLITADVDADLPVQAGILVAKDHTGKEVARAPVGGYSFSAGP